MKLVCKDCHDSMEDCRCIQDTVDMKEPIIQTSEDAAIFIEALTNPPKPNKELIDAFTRHFGIPERQLYSEIEYLIIKWNLDGTRTAGSLIREIMKLIKL
jgi:hypothetical protein